MSEQATEIDDALYAQITSWSEKGEALFEQGNYPEAIKAYEQAFELIPSPRRQWNATVWTLVAIGDSYWEMQDYGEALEAFQAAYNCGTAVDNPFINLRLGQCYYQEGNFDQSANFLMRAYMGDGEKIFEGEAFYLNFLKTRANIS